jgi:hypothetical protein
VVRDRCSSRKQYRDCIVQFAQPIQRDGDAATGNSDGLSHNSQASRTAVVCGIASFKSASSSDDKTVMDTEGMTKQ